MYRGLILLQVLVALWYQNLCLVSCESVGRANGIVGRPNYGSDPSYDENAIDGGSYMIPSRIKVKLVRNIRTVDPDRLAEPELSYYGALGVGSPPKVLNFVFDTGSNQLWLPCYNWFPLANNLHYSDGYKAKDSSTSVQLKKDFSVDYRGTRLSGSMHEDIMTLYEDLTKEDAAFVPHGHIAFGQHFLGISDADNEQFRFKPYDGVVGLAPVAQSNTGTRNVLLSIQATNLARMPGHHDAQYNNTYPSFSHEPMPAGAYGGNIRPNQSHGNNGYYGGGQNRPTGLTNPRLDLVFAFWFNPNQNSRDGGELMIGDLDESRFRGEIIFHKVNSWFDWQLHMQHVLLGSQIVSCQSGCNAIFDTGANSLVGPREDIERIYQELGAYRDERANMMLVDCSRIESYPTFTFRIDGYPYLIYPSHYIRVFRFNNRLFCYLAVKPRDSPDWVLGTSFIGAYYTVFNFSQRLIGFATPQG